MSALDPIEILDTRNIVGEGILWDWRRSQLWWTDIPSRNLYRYDWARGTTQILDTPERVGSFGFVENSDRLIVAFASGIALYDPQQKSVEWLARPEEIVAGHSLQRWPGRPARPLLERNHDRRRIARKRRQSVFGDAARGNCAATSAASPFPMDYA